MSAYRPIDSKREEFRKYLERCGVMDALTKVLVMLYEEIEKPEDALEYLRVNLGDTRPSAAEIEAMRTDLENALSKLEQLELENCELKKKLHMEEGQAKDAETMREKEDTASLAAEERAFEQSSPTRSALAAESKEDHEEISSHPETTLAD